jgi:hypothetical protein
VCDKNGWKRAEKPYFYFYFYFLLAEMESVLENVGSKTEPEYAVYRNGRSEIQRIRSEAKISQNTAHLYTHK